MIIACPACKTRYVVPETAIGDTGRTVRCAKCKHSWFQEPVFDLPPRDEQPSAEDAPVEQAAPSPAPPPPSSAPPPPEPEPEAKPEETPVERATGEDTGEAESGPSINHWRTADRPAAATGATSSVISEAEPGPEPESEPEPPAVDQTVEETVDEPSDENADIGPAASYEEPSDDEEYSDEYDYEESRFGYRPPFTARRNPLKMWTAAAAIFALLAFGTIAAVNFNLIRLPDWAPFSQPTFGIGKSDLELDFPAAEQRTETLPSGTEIFRARGTITNNGRETVDVPPLRIVLRDERERIVFDWNVAPPRSSLAPGESMTVTEAITDVPRSARFAEIGWSPN